MSRSETNREDLLREATALVERVELNIPSHSEPLVVGFRSQGAASFFFGQDPAYHFTTAGALRRAYVGGVLYKADSSRLVALTRERGSAETALVCHNVSNQELITILDRLKDLLNDLHNSLEAGQFQVRGQFPSDAQVVPRLREWLASQRGPLLVADRPNVA